jgi:Fe-S-cluster containining protein
MNTKDNFECTKCGECCRPIVLLSEEDIKRIEALGLTDFIDIDPLNEVTTKILKQKNHVCMFLERVGDEFKCKIYNSRPEICRQYPFNGGIKKIDDCRPKNWEKWMKLNEIMDS